MEFDRSNADKQHSRTSRFAVLSLEEAPDRLILNREGRSSKILASRGMDTLAKKKLRRRPLYMPDLVWRQRVAAITPMQVISDGNIHSLRLQAKTLGIITRGMNGPQIREMIKRKIKNARKSVEKNRLAARISAERDELKDHQPGESLALSRTVEELNKARDLAINNKWLREYRCSNANGEIENEPITPQRDEHDVLLLPSITEIRQQQKLRLSQIPDNIRGPIRDDYTVKPHFIGRYATNVGDNIMEDRSGYALWKQHLYNKGTEAYHDKIHHTEDVSIRTIEPDSYTDKQR